LNRSRFFYTVSKALSHKGKRRNKIEGIMNKFALLERVRALSMALMASAAVSLCVLSGISCSFISVEAKEGEDLLTSAGEALDGFGLVYVGLKCQNRLMDAGIDEMVQLSQHFFHVSVILGGATALLAWTLSIAVPPSKCSWITMAIAGSITAVVQVPIFLIYESLPCKLDPNRQSCSLEMGSYFNMASISLWIVMSVWAQMIHPPAWDQEIEDWRLRKREPVTIQEISFPQNDTKGDKKGKDRKKQRKLNRDVECGLRGPQKQSKVGTTPLNPILCEERVASSKQKRKAKKVQKKQKAPISEVVLGSGRVEADNVSAM
jgi:hypothetical protein